MKWVGVQEFYHGSGGDRTERKKVLRFKRADHATAERLASESRLVHSFGDGACVAWNLELFHYADDARAWLKGADKLSYERLLNQELKALYERHQMEAANASL